MHGVGGADLELRQVQVEVPRSVTLAVDEKGANTDGLGRDRHPAQGINDKCPAESRALAGQIRAKTGEDHFQGLQLDDIGVR
ncbi:MAG: hypothetical protein ACRDNZ_12090 [Streptosporangiaceae bacterium]